MSDPISITAPEGYDQRLWDSIPAVRRRKNPGVHETYVFGQSSSDGTACIACSWQVYEVLTGDEAMARHDADMSRTRTVTGT